MKITPYLLYLNGFENHDGGNRWIRVETGDPSTDETGYLIPRHKIEMIVEPAIDNGLWHVQYKASQVSYPVFCDCIIKTFQDLMALSEVFAHNRHGYTDVDPIELYVPNIYTDNDWKRGESDQILFNENTHEYE